MVPVDNSFKSKARCKHVQVYQLLAMHSYREPAQSVPFAPHPSTDVVYEALCDTYRNSIFNEECRVMVLIDLFKIRTVHHRYLTRQPKLGL